MVVSRGDTRRAQYTWVVAQVLYASQGIRATLVTFEDSLQDETCSRIGVHAGGARQLLAEGHWLRLTGWLMSRLE